MDEMLSMKRKKKISLFCDIKWYASSSLPFSDELLLRTFTDNGLEVYGWVSTLLYLEYVFPMELLENVYDFESFGQDSLSELGLSLSDAVSFIKHIWRFIPVE